MAVSRQLGLGSEILETISDYILLVKVSHSVSGQERQTSPFGKVTLQQWKLGQRGQPQLPLKTQSTMCGTGEGKERVAVVLWKRLMLS